MLITGSLFQFDRARMKLKLIMQQSHHFKLPFQMSPKQNKDSNLLHESELQE